MELEQDLFSRWQCLSTCLDDHSLRFDSAWYDIVSAYIPDVALDARIAHLLEQCHVFFHLLDVFLALSACLVVDDNGLLAIGHHAVRSLGVAFALFVSVENGAFVECLPVG